jgi:hypothetical protein|tara:strand:+ start:293 stop:421 length:129 start_codon:yes stop_codon:yes gene_type:complete
MKIDINVSVDTIEDKEVGHEIIELLIAIKDRLDIMNNEEQND